MPSEQAVKLIRYILGPGDGLQMASICLNCSSPAEAQASIGSHTCVMLLEAGHELVVLDSFSNSSPVALERD